MRACTFGHPSKSQDVCGGSAFALRSAIMVIDFLISMFSHKYTGSPALRAVVFARARRIEELSCADYIDIERLTETVEMSAVHLTRLFKEQLNISPAAYHTRVRIEEAKRRLHVPDAHIKEVAIDLGFAHLSHFSCWFKQHVGIPPREFIKAVR